MNAFTQGSLTVNAYYTRMKTMWDELKAYKPAPVCHCGGMRAWNDYQEQELVMLFLMGLNESYAGIRNQILMVESSPPIAKAFSLVVQEERHRSIGIERAPFGSEAAVGAGTVALAQGGRRRPLCSHCGLIGHLVDRCYKLHGYPLVTSPNLGAHLLKFKVNLRPVPHPFTIVQLNMEMGLKGLQSIISLSPLLKPISSSSNHSPFPNLLGPT